MRRLGVLLLVLGLATIGAQPAQARRVALVIGNASYAHSSALGSPPMDAEAVEAAFKRMKFDLVVRLKDLGVKAIADALSMFRREATGADMAVVYYSGHGIEIDGVNYLVPVDAKLDDPFDAGLQAIALPIVMRQLDGSRKLRVVILDACRDNPFQQRLSVLPDRKSISIGKGFVAVKETDLGQRTLVAFAAREGTTAEDRRGRLSTYTDALIKYIDQPGLEIRLMFGRVRDQVLRETGGRQQPHEYMSLGGEALYLGLQPMAPAPVAQPSVPATTVAGRVSEAAEAWDRTKDTTNIAVLERFIARYKDTFYADWANVRIEELKKLRVAAATPPKAAPPQPGAKPAVSVSPQAEPKPSPAFSAPPVPARCDGVEALVAGDRRCLRLKGSFKDCPECPEMVVIPAGSFIMGSNDGESDEKPAHRVTIGQPFAVGKFELTFVEWQACVAAGGCKHAPSDHGWGKGNRPVIDVSWGDAKGYVAWLSKKTGRTYRLLSEAEWEYAARGVTSSSAPSGRYWWGNDATREFANYGTDQCCGGHKEGRDQWEHTAPVGQFPANAFGLHDMHGNVWEWVHDCYGDNYVGSPTDGSAAGSGACTGGIVRGGSWHNDAHHLRSSARLRYYSLGRGFIIGFRVARTLTP